MQDGVGCGSPTHLLAGGQGADRGLGQVGARQELGAGGPAEVHPAALALWRATAGRSPFGAPHPFAPRIIDWK